jgi:inner membrane protein
MIEQEERTAKWYDGSAILIKLGIIAVIILALLIPSSWIQDMVKEREGYQQSMVKNVSETWAGAQLVQGPVLALPYKHQITITGTDNKKSTREQVYTLYVLPQELKIKANVKTDKFERGVYDATVYNSKIDLQGSFNKPDLTGLGIDPETIMYDKARLVFSLSDMNGLQNNPVVKIGAQDYTPEPVTGGNIPFEKGLQVHFALLKDQGFTFTYQLDLKGSNELDFLHLGKTTDVEISSDWTHPGFNGAHLPDSRTIDAKGFNAKWHMIYYKRPFPQQWANDDSVLTNAKVKADAVVGVKLHVPIDQYRKVMRTTKYSTLIILLTFVSLFLTELIRKQRIHLFNYTLIGAAMIVYYTLLLSFSEQIGYNLAYLVSSVATIALISWFTASLLKNGAAAGMFAGILTVFYGFIFVLIQLEELSLLVGSIALFVVVAALMYFSRKINWAQH